MTFKANPGVPNPDMTQSRKWNLSDARQKLTVGTGVAVGGYQAVNAANITSLHSTMEAASTFVHAFGIPLLLGGLAAGVIADWYLKSYMKQDVQSGRATMSGTLENVDTGNAV